MYCNGMARPRAKLDCCGEADRIVHRLQTEPPGAVRERLLAVRLGLQGELGLSRIALAVGRSRATIQVWFDTYRRGGIAALIYDARSDNPGRPSELSGLVLSGLQQLGKAGPTEPACVASARTKSPIQSKHKKLSNTGELRPAAKAIVEILHHNPKDFGINRSNWTQQSLAVVFEKLYGRKPTAGTVGRLLKEAGFRWKKSRQFLTSPDPNYKEKVELLLKTLQSLKVDEDLFFIDEMGPIAVKRHGGRCYTPENMTPTHPQNQRAKGSISLYGALSAKTNQVVWFYGKSKDSAGMIELAEILYNQQHDKSRIYLTWDAASWHRSEELVQWTDAFNAWNSASGTGPHIAFIPLPSNSQFLDVIEAVFSGMKRAVIHNSDYQSPAEMKAAISMHFRERNDFFRDNPKRVGKKMWEIDFFQDHNNIRWGNYREW